MAILRAVKDRCPDCPVIMVTGTGSEEIAVEAMKAGLDDYVLKAAHNFGRLSVAVKAVLERAQERRGPRGKGERLSSLIGNNPPPAVMKKEGRRFVYRHPP